MAFCSLNRNFAGRYGTNQMKQNGFPKTERLTLRSDIEQLFASGARSLSVFPVRAIFRHSNKTDKMPVKIMVSVSKRRLHHAVDRNRAKRQIREAYRLHQSILSQYVKSNEQPLHIAFVWTAGKPQSSGIVNQSIQRLLQLISERL